MAPFFMNDCAIPTRLFSRSFERLCSIHRQNRNKHLAVAAGAKLHVPFDLGEDSVIPAKANAGAGMPFGATLANQEYCPG